MASMIFLSTNDSKQTSLKQFWSNKIFCFLFLSLMASNSLAAITSGNVLTYYQNPFVGKNVASFNWSSGGDLYWMEGDNNFAQDLKVHKFDGNTLSAIYTAASYSGTWVLSDGDNIYFDDGSLTALFKYDSIGGGAATQVFQQSNAWGYTIHNNGLFIAGADVNWDAKLYYSALDGNGDLTGPLVDLGFMGSPSGPIAFDAAGNLYYASGYSAGKIHKYSAAEVALAIAGTPLTDPAGHEIIDFNSFGHAGATGMEFDSNGHLVVTLTSFGAPSDLVTFYMDDSGDYLGTAEITAQSSNRMTSVRLYQGQTYFSDQDGIYQVIPGVNTDGDRYPDTVDTDDDNDGMPDSWENNYGLNPLVDDSGDDQDGDGVTNLEEYVLGTDPTVSDLDVPNDVDADGDGDMLFQDGSGSVVLWTMQDANKDSAVWLGTNSTASLLGNADVDNDGDSDLLFQNAGTGEVILWVMQYGARESVVSLGAQSGYTLSFTGDLDGDGDADLVFGDGSGNVIVWIMESGAKQSAAWLGQWAGHTVAATADIDRDGDDDIVTQDASGNVNVIEMENGAKVAARWLGVWSGRTVVGAGDADADGDDDIFMAGASGSDVMVVELENGVKVTGRWLGAWAGTAVLAVGDIDNDGDADLIQQNSGTGSVQVVEIENGIKVTARWLTTIAYDVKNVLDADADGDVDIALQDGSGNVALIELQNGSKVGGAKWLGINTGQLILSNQ